MAADFRAAEDIRALVAHAGSEGDQEGWTLRWRAWALGVADRLDPAARLMGDGAGGWRLSEPEWLAVGADEAGES